MFFRHKKTKLYILCFVTFTILLYLNLKKKDGAAVVRRGGERSGEKKIKYLATTVNSYKYQRFYERQRHLQNKCPKVIAEKYQHACAEEEIKGNLKYVKERNYIYCSIEKTGSTFWRRILHVSGGWGNTSDPSRIELIKAYDEKGGYSHMKNKTWTDVENLFQHSKSLMFVRNPYSRLFSAWLDKFYSPNVFYWNATGKDILKTQRKRFDPGLTQCASDVSFIEFVNHTVDEILSNKCVDGHFSSMYSHCLPCNLSFSYIGKYETIKEDTVTLIEMLGLSDIVKFNDFEIDAVYDTIFDSSSWVYTHKERVIACGMSFSCALFRVWGRLQSRGLLSKKINFPYQTKEEIDTLKQEQFELDIVKAHMASDVDDLKDNRQEALHQALKTLTTEVLNKVLVAFEIDFDLFDYDRIPFSFAEPRKKETSAFNYFSSCPKGLL